MNHIPVLINEVIEFISPKDNEIYVDCTFGAGGYSKRLLESANCKVVAFDVDESAKEFAKKLNYPGRFTFINSNFESIEEELNSIGVDSVDGIVFDLGVSSMQLDQGERGFSFNKEGKLDMRMGGEGRSAEDFVNNLSEKELANIIYKYGDEKFSRKIAANIVRARTRKKIETTTELAEIVRFSLPAKFKGHRTDPATKTFQAIRIWVNNELNILEKSLPIAKKLLKNNGRMVVVTFHSGEDRIVKNFMNEHSGKNDFISRYLPSPEKNKEEDLLKLITRKAVTPSEKEVEENPRSRSAKLRAAVLIKNNKRGENALD